MTARNFSTHLYSAGDRAVAWRSAMTDVHLSVTAIPRPEQFQGSLLSKTSALGTRITVINADPQTVESVCEPRSGGVWVSMITHGDAVWCGKGQTKRLTTGDIAYGRVAQTPAVFTYSTQCRQILLMVPPVVIDPRLAGPIASSIGYLPANAGIAKVFSNLIIAFADAVEHMKPEEITPVELSLAQFLISCISTQDKTVALGGAAANRAAHLHHIRLTIDGMLGNPSLDTSLIAKREGVSIRYLQKLFSSSGQTFAKYVHDRRLERCHVDLMNTDCAGETITDICFRWGFNSSAHFSRAFRAKYGVSPRDFRLAQV